MKRFLCVFAVSAILFLSLCVAVAANQASPVTVTLNGGVIDCASYGQEAAIVEGRTLVPLRAIFEALGATVEWNGETKTVNSALDKTQIKLTIGDKALYKNGEKVELDVPALIVNNRTLVPVRAVAESFGVEVEWDSKTRTVMLMTGVYAYNAYLEGVMEEVEPKSDLDREILATVGGVPLSAAAVKSYVTAACSGGQNPLDETVRGQMETLFKQDAAFVHFAFREQVKLEEVDINQVKAKVFTLQLQLGDFYEKAFAESPYTKFYYHLNMSLNPVVYSKIAEAYSDADNKEMRSKVLEYFEENNYVRAKHILVMFPGVNEGRTPTEDEREATFSKALDILVKVKAMKSPDEFDALVKEYNEDPGMKNSPDGYYFTYGKMVEPFEKAAFALEIGKTSSLVETNYGFHIIQRLPLDNENLVNAAEYKEAVKEVLWETLAHIADGLEVEYADNFDERVKDFSEEYQKSFVGK